MSGAPTDPIIIDDYTPKFISICECDETLDNSADYPDCPDSPDVREPTEEPFVGVYNFPDYSQERKHIQSKIQKGGLYNPIVIN